jgi:hypothetical protein
MDCEALTQGNTAMTLRNADARLIKLEARRQRVDEFLAVWRKPGTDVVSSLADAKFAGGDRVICFEWFGDGSPPAPKWHRKLRAEFSPEEQGYIKRALQQIVDDSPPVAAEDLRWLDTMTEGELLHHIWGVAL